MRKLIVVSLAVLLAGAVLWLALPHDSGRLPLGLPSGGDTKAMLLSRLGVGTQPTQAPTRKLAPLPTPNLRANPADKDYLNSIRIAEQFSNLIKRAKRDPAFAFSLSLALHKCAKADESYRRVIENLDDPILTQSPQSRLEQAERTFARCAGLTDEQMASRYDLVTMAARAGVLDAQVQFKHLMSEAILDGTLIRRPNAMDEFRANAEAFTVAAARTNDRGALNMAYALYSDGRLVPRDPVRAYLYLQRLVLVDPSLTSMLARVEAELTAEQLATARQQPQLSP